MSRLYYIGLFFSARMDHNPHFTYRDLLITPVQGGKKTTFTIRL